MAQVLLVDDDPIQLRVRETVLRDAGFEVSVATTPDGALALLRSTTETGNVGAVITDHIMPGTGGAEFVKLLREVNDEVPVIVVTGMPDAEEEYAGLNVAFRQKPIHPDELINLLRSVIAPGG